MWRSLIFLILLAGAGYYWWKSHDSEALYAAEAASIQRAEKKVGIHRMLASDDRFEFTNVVLTLNGTDGFPDFRGQIQTQETTVATYGQIKSLCEEEFARAECWEIALLEADGKPVELQAAPEVAVDTPALPKTPESAEPTAENAESAPSTEDGEEDPVEEQSAAVSAPKPTHQVDRSRINSRSGPGTENPVITQLTQSTDLILIETQSGWGRFEVVNGPAAGKVVWIALSLTSVL